MSHGLGGCPDELLIEAIYTWPEGTVGRQKEIELLKLLNRLCKEHGYGAIPQYCDWIKQLWLDNTKVEDFKKANKERLEMLQNFLKEGN